MVKLPAIAYHYVHDHLPGVYGQDRANYMGRITGEFRPPKKGEWYLSGAIPECYRAPNDLTQSHYIVKIVRIQRIETIIEVENG